MSMIKMGFDKNNKLKQYNVSVVGNVSLKVDKLKISVVLLITQKPILISSLINSYDFIGINSFLASKT